MKMLLIVMLLCPPVMTNADSNEPAVKVTEHQKAVHQVQVMDKFRLYMGNFQSRKLFYRSIAEASLETLERCQMRGGENCLVLVNFIQRAKPAKPAFCYSVLIMGFMCEFHKDLTACAYYKPNKEQCSAFINERTE